MVTKKCVFLPSNWVTFLSLAPFWVSIQYNAIIIFPNLSSWAQINIQQESK